jgi:hypothetical protein
MEFPSLNGFALCSQSFTPDSMEVALFDEDTRRVVTVAWDGPVVPRDDDPEYYIPLEKAADALRRHIDDLPPDVVRIQVDESSGDLLSVCTDRARDVSRGTDHFLLEDYQLPPSIAAKTVLRSELAELSRLHHEVDLVSYRSPSSPCSGGKGGSGSEDRPVVFKYNIDCALPLWRDIQILARQPPSLGTHIPLVDRLVLDETTRSRVVGFTMRHIASKSLKDSQPPRFKLKWLRQLTSVVDVLNLRHGIIHQDIADRNLLVDPETDSIALIDFNVACRVGVKSSGRYAENEYPGADDVKGVMVFLYRLITQDPADELFRVSLVDERDIRDPARWVKHPSVELDAGVEDFYFELMAWVRQRRRDRGAMKHYTEAPGPLDWPRAPFDRGRMEYVIGGRHVQGVPYLDWRRPPSSKVDPARCLLATGRYADEEPDQEGSASSGHGGCTEPDAAARVTAGKPSRRKGPRAPPRRSRRARGQTPFDV